MYLRMDVLFQSLENKISFESGKEFLNQSTQLDK